MSLKEKRKDEAKAAREGYERKMDKNLFKKLDVSGVNNKFKDNFIDYYKKENNEVRDSLRKYIFDRVTRLKSKNKLNKTDKKRLKIYKEVLDDILKIKFGFKGG